MSTRNPSHDTSPRAAVGTRSALALAVAMASAAPTTLLAQEGGSVLMEEVMVTARKRRSACLRLRSRTTPRRP